MARAYPQSEPQEFAQSPGEWHALRGELVALLDQVENQVARQSRQDSGHPGLGERMHDLRMQVASVEPDNRHREALRSVKRAVDRFSDRDDSFAGRSIASNPRDTLQSAIQQIRDRQGVQAPRAAVPQPQQTSFADLPQFTELAQAVGGISGRLERLEGELRTQARSQTGNVKEIAEQVGQLSHVVELLAGAVGETGQVKRLEGQIASLARMIAQGPQVDLSALTQRLDDVSATVGKLADLQMQYAGQLKSSDTSAAMGESMRAIEDGVRNVYDRLDAIERHSALAPADLEPITRELGRITEAMASPSQPQGLVELVDVLNARISDIEMRNPAVAELKLDVEELRGAVLEAMEPRFAALEMQIEGLSDRLNERPAEINIGQLESQVRQLVARMDQTGEQLSGLAKLYQKPAAPAPAPDFDALADLVANRTSEAMARVEPSAPALPVETDYEEIEKRVARVMRDAASQQQPAEDFSGMHTGIREVNERLARLEQSLLERAEEAKRIEAAPLADFTPHIPNARPAPIAPEPLAESEPERADDPIAEVIRAAEPMPAMPPRPAAAPRRSDAMPANPSEDAPLVAKPFPPAAEAGPVRAALEVKNGPRKHHPGLGDGVTSAPATPAPEVSAEVIPSYDPVAAGKPPRPVSSFDAPAEPASRAPAKPAEPASSDATPSANTFIQAHRRAARQASSAAPAAKNASAKSMMKTEPDASGNPVSLIGRALARLQGAGAAAAPAAAPAIPAAAETVAPKVKEPKRPRKPTPERKLAGDKKPRGEAWSPDDNGDTADTHVKRVEPTDGSLYPVDSDEDVATGSFLTRYRRPILLAAVLAAATVLAGNLVMQKLRDAAPAETVQGTGQTETDAGAGLLDAEPIGNVSSLSKPSRVIEMVDSMSTGSIETGNAAAMAARPMSFVPATATPALSATFGKLDGKSSSEILTGSVSAAAKAATDAASPLVMPEPLATAVISPIKVEMPPEGLGPEELRRAAADGDARAQFEVAAIYTEGRAVTEDPAQAAIWYERSAAQGFAPAQYRLGNLYENGRGVEKDLQQARLWYQRAAEAGNRMAMHNLAALYAGGELGKQEFDAAAEWFEQAAERGMKDSQFNLGMLYARGLGVKQDMQASFKWFSLAAKRGDKDAAVARDDIARSLSAEDAGRLNDEIAAWRPQRIDLAANYAPIGTWSAKFDPGEAITKKEVVLNVQAALSQLGYDLGTPDGVVGPMTAEAIKAFERATGMSEVGVINPRLLAVLGSQPV